MSTQLSFEQTCGCLDSIHPGLTHDEHVDILEAAANEALKRQAVASATWAMAAMETVAKAEIRRLDVAIRLMETGRIRDASKLPARERKAYEEARGVAWEGALKRALDRRAPRPQS